MVNNTMSQIVSMILLNKQTFIISYIVYTSIA